MKALIEGVLCNMIGTILLVFSAMIPILFFSISYISSIPNDPKYLQLIFQMHVLVVLLFCAGALLSSFGTTVLCLELVKSGDAKE